MGPMRHMGPLGTLGASWGSPGGKFFYLLYLFSIYMFLFFLLIPGPLGAPCMGLTSTICYMISDKILENMP